MKALVLLFAGLSVSSSAFAADKLVYICAEAKFQTSEAVIKASKNRIEIFASKNKKLGTTHKVAGYGDLERVNAVENQGYFTQILSKKVGGDSAFRLTNKQGDVVTIMYDTDAGSKGGTLVALKQSFELQCIAK